MKFEYLEQEGITEVSTDLDDKCTLCKNFDVCPLLGALEINLVYPSADKLTIEECPIFELEELYDGYYDE